MIPSPTAARLALALVCSLAACLLLAAAPAAAKLIHPSEGSFNGSDAPGGPFTKIALSSAAADESNGDVYVLESSGLGVGNDVVDKFEERGRSAGVQISGAATPSGSATNGQPFAFPFLFGLTGGSPGVAGVAVDNTAAGPHKGSVYIADTGHQVVDRFSASGGFECQITAKVPSMTEEEEDECNGAAGSEPTAGPAGFEPTGLAVDPSGNLYVADEAHSAIDVFAPSGAFKEQITSPELGAEFGLGTIAVDGTGDLYVANVGKNVAKFVNGAFKEVVQEAAYGVAVDRQNGRVYIGGLVNEGNEGAISEYKQAAGNDELLKVFANARETYYQGLAVGAAGKVYAPILQFGFEAGEVAIWSGDVIVPDLTTQPATEVQETSATLHGHLDPDALDGGPEVTQCQFEYGLSKAYGETAPCEQGQSYPSPADVSAQLTGLRPSSTYHFRLEAANSDGVPGTGEDEVLTTPGPPTVDFQTVEALQAKATFKAKIDPWGHPTTCQLQYVTDAGFQESAWTSATTVPCAEAVGSGFGDVTVWLKVSGLQRETLYHYRFLATNEAGLSGHRDLTFETYRIRKFSLQDLSSSEVVQGVGISDAWKPGEPSTEAGVHPKELVTTITMSHTTEFTSCASRAFYCTEEAVEPFGAEQINNTAVNTKDFKVALPPGLIGNPTALPKCSRFGVADGGCPADTQVGMIELWVDWPLGRTGGFAPLPEENDDGNQSYYTSPVYNIQPAGINPAEFGAYIEGQAPAWIPFHVRTGGDYGISADSLDLTTVGGGITRVRVRVWGVPLAPSHFYDHCNENHFEHRCETGLEEEFAGQPVKPLLRNPTSCAGPQAAAAMADSWQEKGLYVQETTELEGFTGCNQLQFKPKLEARPTTNVADSPSGLEVDLHVPQPEGCTEESGEVACETGEADLKDTKVTLPPGLIVNPSSASGLEGCSATQIELHGPEAPTCPDPSKIGTVEVDTPLLKEYEPGTAAYTGFHPLRGAVYLATPYDNPFHSLLAIYAVVNDPQTGVVIKLPGHIETDPKTGQLTTTFGENPQLPFEDFKLDFFAGSHAVLRTAPTCGKYETESLLTPWSAPESGPPVESKSPFEITKTPSGGPCPATASQEPHAPGFQAGTETPTAGAYSPFVLHLHREDDSQELQGIETVLPPGLTARLATVATCPTSALEAAEHKSGRQEQQSPSCPSSSEVGTVDVGAGAGPAPYFTSGHVYLAGPYKGAPLSVAIVTPAVAGPYDLGDVVVRAALYVNPETAQVTVKSDPIPTILQGIPLDVKTINVKMGRPDFTLNPTNCEKMAVTGVALSALGQSASLTNPFQVGSCEALGFKPKLSVTMSGQTKRTGDPALKAVLTMKPGQANIAKAQVTLPRGELVDNAHIGNVCARTAYISGTCPASSEIGHAQAITPLLEKPLEGPVYLVSGYEGHALPDVAADLNGQIRVLLHGKVDSVNEALRNTFEVVPDAPVSKFTLSLDGGKKGLIENSHSLCDQKRSATALFVGQNGRVSEAEPPLHVRCKGSKHSQRKKRHPHHRATPHGLRAVR